MFVMMLYVCFVDFEKTFDSALLHKLTQLDIKGPFYDILRNMYLENILHGTWMTGCMDAFAPQLGVRQGQLKPKSI